METKRFVSSTVNVIFKRQTCGQRSSRAAQSKRRALGNYFFERVCYIFLVSKCRGDRDLGPCTSSGLAFGEPMRSGEIRDTNVFRHRKNQILSLRIGSPNASPEDVHRPRSRSKNLLALGVSFPQPCSSNGCRFAASRSRVQNYRRIVSFPQQKFR